MSQNEKINHHRTFIVLLLILVMAVGFLFGRGVEMSGELQMIMLLTNTFLMLLILHFLLELYTGRKALEVIDVTPFHVPKEEEPVIEEVIGKKETKKTGKKTSAKKSANKKTTKKTPTKKTESKKTAKKTSTKKPTSKKTTKKTPTKKTESKKTTKNRSKKKKK